MVEPKTIYLEADEEVTSVIDKLRKTEFSDIVLVVPKDAGLLHSIVNLKLIKRQSETLGKNVSLVTQDKVGRNLAEKVGLPAASKVGQVPAEAEEASAEPAFNIKKKDDASSGDPIEDTNEIVYKKKSAETEPIIEGPNEIIVTEDEDTESEAKFHKKEVEKKEPGNIMPKLPRKKLIIAFAAILIVLLGVGFIYLPRAKATILVQAEKKEISLEFTGKTDASVDTGKSVIPSKVIEATKETSKKFAASGKKNIGTQATGTLTISNISGENISWVVGTRFSPTSNSSIVYKAVSAVNVPNNSILSINVQAANPGDQYNGYGNNQGFTLTAGGLKTNVTVACAAGMSGGTNKEVAYVTQGDYNSAKDSLSKEALADATTDFNKKAEELKVIDNSKKEEVTSVSSSPNVGGEGSDFTMTVKVSVKALTFNMNDVNELIKAEVQKQFGLAKEIINDGSAGSDIEVTSQDLKTGAFVATAKSEAYVSTKLDQNQIKDELKGVNATKATNYIKGLEGVDDVKLEFWPPFLKIFPRMQSHIYLKIQVSDNQAS